MERFLPKVVLKIQARGSGIAPNQHIHSHPLNESQDSPGSAPLSKYNMDIGFRVDISAIKKKIFREKDSLDIDGLACRRC